LYEIKNKNQKVSNAIMPNISIIIPVYRVERYLHKCIESVLKQTYKDFEVILVDDGSPDKCGEICDAYEKKSKNGVLENRIIAVHQKNGGLSAARNTGINWVIDNSDSQWIVFVDSDDYLHPDYLKKLFEAADRTDADIVMCDFEHVNKDGCSVESEHEFPSGLHDNKNDFFCILYSNWRTVVAWNKLYKKRLFSEIRYAEGKIYEDEFIIHYLLAACNKVYYINKPLYFYLHRDDSITSSSLMNVKTINYLEAGIERYWFCKENQFPTDYRFVSRDYMEKILNLRGTIDKNHLKLYKRLRTKYRKVFLDANHYAVKSRLIFDFFYIYKIIKANKEKP